MSEYRELKRKQLRELLAALAEMNKGETITLEALDRIIAKIVKLKEEIHQLDNMKG